MSALDTGTTLTRTIQLMRALISGLALCTIATTASAQSIVAGSVAGAVADAAGIPLTGVHLILTQTASGITRESETDRLGRFEFLLLQPGEYSLFAERLGDKPVRVETIPVGQGRRVELSIALSPVELPVMEVTSLPFGDAPLKIGGRDGGRLFTKLELDKMPSWSRDVSELGRFASNSSRSMATEGLPAQYVGLRVDGVPYQGTMHGGVPSKDLRTAAFTVSSFDQLQLLTNGVDVEYNGFAGASLSGFSRSGTRDLQFGVFADWVGSATSGSDYFDTSSLSFNSMRGGIVATGPIVRDTSHFVVGFEARRLESPLPRTWVPTDSDSSFVSAAANSFGVDLSGYLQPRIVSTDIYTGFGRLDWQFGERTVLSVRGEIASLKTANPVLGRQRIPTLGVSYDGGDISGTASLATMLSRVLGLELRVGIASGQREYSVGELPATSLAGGPIILGTDPVLPGDYSQFNFWANETLHLRLPGHRFKLGGTARISSFNQSYAPWRVGGYSFGDVNDFTGLNGRFVQSVSSFPSAEFMTREFGGFLQDTWTPLRGVAITAGFRLDWELLPKDEVQFNKTWFDLTGVSNTNFSTSIFKFSPRLGLLVERSSYQVRADWTIHYGPVDSWTFGEAVTTSRTIESRQGLGQLSGWPNVPDSASAPIQGPVLSLLSPDYRPPRTMRTSVGLMAKIGRNAIFDLSGAYRRTENLTRRHDLNLISAPSSQDQYGRPMYGNAVQVGGILGVEPGSNRRFSDFDLVSSLDADGFSDYWGITARLERRFGSGLQLFASYTYSQTKDNWLSGLNGEPAFQLTPFPDSIGGADWARGVSDFDVPNRFTLGAEFRFGFLSLAASYRGQSGLPFTPGFRYGQDMNGEGSFRNDPAFVDDQVEGMSEVLSQWQCLRGQIGRFAERNACRGQWLSTLDLRLTVSTIRIGSYPIELVVDGLNLLDPDLAQPDNALFLLDPSGTISRDPATGVTTVPLVVNTNFGKPVTQYSTGRAVRFGLRVNYD